MDANINWIRLDLPMCFQVLQIPTAKSEKKIFTLLFSVWKTKSGWDRNLWGVWNVWPTWIKKAGASCTRWQSSRGSVWAPVVLFLLWAGPWWATSAAGAISAHFLPFDMSIWLSWHSVAFFASLPFPHCEGNLHFTCVTSHPCFPGSSGLLGSNLFYDPYGIRSFVTRVASEQSKKRNNFIIKCVCWRGLTVVKNRSSGDRLRGFKCQLQH